MKYLVDSSTWIPFLRGQSDLPPIIAKAMAEGQAHICPIIWIEIYRGIRSKREEKLAADLADLCPSLAIDDAVWIQASKLARKALRSGLNCPLADILIVACARHHGAELHHSDKHMAALLDLL